jgi:hypothetical protein
MVYISKGRHLDSDTPAQQPLTQAQSRPPLICTMVTGPRTPLERLPLPPRPLLVEWRREKRPATICFCQPRTGPSSRAPATTAACEPGEGKPVGTINGCGQGCRPRFYHKIRLLVTVLDGWEYSARTVPSPIGRLLLALVALLY